MLSFHFSLCITNQQIHLRSSRKLLIATKSNSTTVNVWKVNGGAMKEPKKAVDSSLRKRPPSRANPTQNK
ncbi:hypothetical protein BVRB_014080 [Beta vulgaris subsp. vulgaris]|uniref:Uncharacterized protein n=1 Tax=Beta vulgaris subsp. vulgaris TaxID=3555 RepID=A0A0J8DVP0_BETVV|nr:hypothetical protein BVRB_014080 [Beta vulgaris subsp. vulgaris]